MEKPAEIIKLVSKKDQSMKMVESHLDEFVGIIKEKKCQAFFAVIITDDGSVMHNAVYGSDIMALALSGAIEAAKSEFIKAFSHE